MLEGLEKVDWASLQHAGGSAEDVPDMIRAMISSDPEARQGAFRAAYAALWHDGAVQEAAAAAAPFLIEIARTPDLQDRSAVLELLFHLAHGNGSPEARLDSGPARSALEEPVDFTEALEGARAWAHASASAVAEGRDAYRSLLADPAPLLRRHAARMLTCCPDHRAEVLPALVRAYDEDPDAGVRATALYAVAVLAATEHRPLLQVALTDEEPLVRLSASLSWSALLGEPPPSRVVDMLVDFLEDADNIGYDALLFGEDCVSDIGMALAWVEGPRRVEIAERLLEMAESGRAAWSVAGPLLHLAFDGPQPELTWAGMSETQRRVLRFVASRAWSNKDGTWSTFFFFADLLREFGLEAEGQKVAGYDPARGP